MGASLRRTVLAAVFVPCALALAACSGSTANSGSAASSATPSPTGSTAQVGQGGGDNGGLDSAQVVARYQSALALATTDAAHVKGTLVQGGQSTAVDIQINKNGTSEGYIAANGTKIPFISVGGIGYMQYTASIEVAAKIDPNSQTGKLILDKWAASNTTLGASYNQAIAPMASWSGLAQITGSSADTYTYQGTATINGQRAVQYKDTSTSAGVPDALVSFQASGPMLPIQMSAGSFGGLTFTWDQPTTVTAPPAADLVTIKQ